MLGKHPTLITMHRAPLCSGNVEQFTLQYYPDDTPATGALLAGNNPVPACLEAGVQPVLSIQIQGQGYTDRESQLTAQRGCLLTKPAAQVVGVTPTLGTRYNLVRALPRRSALPGLQGGRWTPHSCNWSCSMLRRQTACCTSGAGEDGMAA